MNISEQQIFAAKQELQRQVEEYEKQLFTLVEKQKTLHSVEELAQSILQYDEITRQIEDRNHVFILLSDPPETLRSPFIKAELFSYFEAAETIGPDFVNFLVDDFITQIRADIENGEDNTVDLIQAEYKEYILPGKIIAQRFTEVDTLIDEMNRFCKMVDKAYDETQGNTVLRYAFEVAIDADTQNEPLIQALQKIQFRYLPHSEVATLLDHIEERMAILRFDDAKKKSIAMEKAVKMLEQQGNHNS